MEFVQNILNVAKKQKLTEQKICELINGNKSTVYDWKKGKSKPKADELIILSEYLNVTIDYLLKGTDSTKLTQDEEYILSIYNQLTEKNKAKAEGYIEERLKEQKSQNKEQSYTA